MSYLVMECRVGYAVVLSSDGEFLRVANLGYQVGQTVFDVVRERSAEEAESEKAGITAMKRPRRLFISILAAAACLGFAFWGTDRLFLSPYATVRIQINPDVLLSMNRLQYVVGIESMNEDGKVLVEGYQYFGKNAMEVSEELTDRAKELGYLSEGGDITLTVDGPQEDWTAAAEETFVTGLYHHCNGSVHVSSSSAEHDEEEHHRIKSQAEDNHHSGETEEEQERHGGETEEKQKHHNGESQTKSEQTGGKQTNINGGNESREGRDYREGSVHSSGKHRKQKHD